MSFNTRIPKSFVVRSDEKVSANDKHVVKSEKFYEESMDVKIKNAENRLKQKEVEAEEEIERTKERFMSESYDEIYQKAFDEAKIKADQEIKEKMEKEVQNKITEADRYIEEAISFQKAIHEEAEKEKKVIIESKKSEMVDLLYMILTKVYRNEITEDMIDLHTMFEKTLKEYEDEVEKVYVKLHPESKKVIEKHNVVLNNLVLIADSRLGQMDMIIESADEMNDFRIEKQIEQAQKILRGVLDD